MPLLDEKLNIDEFKKLEQIVYAILGKFLKKSKELHKRLKKLC